MTTENTAVAEESKAKKEKAVVTQVVMNDGTGRVAEFAGKRRMLKFSGKGPDGKLYTRIDFINGETRTFELVPALIEKAALHGFEQKLGDEVAGETNIDDMVSAIDSLGARLQEAKGPESWNQPREPGDSFSGSHVIVKAICEVSGKTKDEVIAWIDKKLSTPAKNEKGEEVKVTRQALYKALRGSKQYGPTIAKMESEKSKKDVDVAVDDLV
jgi:hypothetical protein